MDDSKDSFINNLAKNWHHITAWVTVMGVVVWNGWADPKVKDSAKTEAEKLVKPIKEEIKHIKEDVKKVKMAQEMESKKSDLIIELLFQVTTEEQRRAAKEKSNF